MSQKDDIVSMEAVRERKAARQQRSGETSRGNDATQLIDKEGEKVSIVIHKMNAGSKGLISGSLEKKFKSLDEALMVNEAENSTKPKIQKIPFMLRDNDNFKKYLEPRVVSIGPYHAKNSNLQVTHEIKLKLAALFIKDGGISRNVLYEKIMEKISNFRECYAEEATKCYENNIEELAWMFLVDGCALLHYIICASQMKEGRDYTLERLKIKKDHMAFFQQDVFLLDNQLPYELLDLLIGLSNKQEELKLSIKNFILDSINAPPGLYIENEKNFRQLQPNNPLHLLDLLRTVLIQQINPHIGVRERLRQILIGILGEKVFNKLTFKKKHVWHSSFRNIEELIAVGISLKPSKTSSIRSITFSWGTLTIPPIIVDDSTAAKLLNMAAYEMCPDFQNGFEVSSYIFFMDSLIDRAQDVKELRESGILHNALGSDEEVALLFNKISIDLVPNPIYSGVRQRIQNHYDNKWMTWIAQFMARHFHSPWSVLAFMAAIIALASSIVQTVYTVEGYYKPDKPPIIYLAP
ncbi:hypothetical protein EZV62_005115 [Acer yangbiense]|uniref:Uncharacterized protein n=1 Tax=Acer yangbiense TaxID=1000413 RepID=A0A5C7ILZ7_9ROSI|nr:hypothetical protein EZV62_005115 [Acer yangbiense]